MRMNFLFLDLYKLGKFWWSNITKCCGGSSRHTSLHPISPSGHKTHLLKHVYEKWPKYVSYAFSISNLYRSPTSPFFKIASTIPFSTRDVQNLPIQGQNMLRIHHRFHNLFILCFRTLAINLQIHSSKLISLNSQRLTAPSTWEWKQERGVEVFLKISIFVELNEHIHHLILYHTPILLPCHYSKKIEIPLAKKGISTRYLKRTQQENSRPSSFGFHRTISIVQIFLEISCCNFSYHCHSQIQIPTTNLEINFSDKKKFNFSHIIPNFFK